MHQNTGHLVVLIITMFRPTFPENQEVSIYGKKSIQWSKNRRIILIYEHYVRLTQTEAYISDCLQLQNVFATFILKQ